MTLTSFNNDSAALSQVLARAAGTFRSPNGLGSGRDPSSYLQVTPTSELSDAELALLFVNEYLCQHICTLYPLEANQLFLRFQIGTTRKKGNYGVVHDDLMAYLDSRCDREEGLDNELNPTSLTALFYEVAVSARLFGVAYLLLGVEDGEDWDKPIRSDRIKSLRWIEPLYHTEVMPDWNGKNYARPKHYRVLYSSLEEGERIRGNQLIHRSRIIPFHGVLLPEEVSRRRTGRPSSVLQGVWRSLARASQTFDAGAYLVKSSSFFDYGLKGLSQIKDEQVRSLIEARMQSIMMSLDVLKAIVRDSETEQVQFAARPMTGVREILDLLLEQVSHNTDIPRFKLFETSEQRGLSGGDKSKAERFLWSQLLDSWKTRHYKDPLLYLGRIAARAKDFRKTGGKALKDLTIEVPSSLQMTPQEMLEMRSTHMNTMATALQSQILAPYEIRVSTYGGSQWASDITLDDRITEQMEATIVPPEAPSPEDDLEQFDD